MSSSTVTDQLEEPPVGWRARLRQVGPGIMAAATGVGAGDLVATMVAGSRFGYTLLWAVLVGTIFKLALAEAVGRWHLTSGRTILSGWRTLGIWALIYFGIYAVIWGFVYGATAMSASGLPLNALFPAISVRYWAMICGLLGFALVWFGRYAIIEKLMTVLVGVMFVTVVGTAILVVPNFAELFKGAVPTLPDGSLVYVLGLVGGVGGTITMAAYGYWTLAKGWRSSKWLPMMRTDNAVGYVMTGIFVIAMLIVGAELLLGQKIISGDKGLLFLGDTLAADYGQWARIPFLIGFFAVSFTSVIGVWHGVSLLFADWWRLLRLPKDVTESVETYEKKAGERSVAYRGYVLWLTFPPMALLFLDQPFQLTVVYGVLGALFMPFLAATLLVLLNTSRVPREGRSRWLSNGLLSICLAMFAYLAYTEVVKFFS
ncbi:Nramp family divalent metal transporter [Amycolatopsis keratiniphila]|uniref:Nramp family divalent metal transporter n=1 Tax=Amycolatopsis keratiniphila TaxID=129921 RepID=UPI0008794092|nr:Nramp family divalent metal transporter [Amycolatopsis keratiniphila]OLZ56209.1 iron transporter [Amycolatopsis keratiniphila subsp. nogabecina]SDU52517.1 Mn2+ and Fe2+ transporters of the NRAMP family [Amycolatopsis keratiniphila]